MKKAAKMRDNRAYNHNHMNNRYDLSMYNKIMYKVVCLLTLSISCLLITSCTSLASLISAPSNADVADAYCHLVWQGKIVKEDPAGTYLVDYYDTMDGGNRSETITVVELSPASYGDYEVLLHRVLDTSRKDDLYYHYLIHHCPEGWRVVFNRQSVQ